MQIYGYCRISTPQQNIERQIRNILATHPTAHIIREVYTGTTYQGRRELDKLLHTVQAGDTIVFDSVSRMSRNADEGCQLYEDLYAQNVTLCFLKEPHINTETYRQTIQRQISTQLKTGNAATDSFVSSVIAALNQYTVDLAKEQIHLAFAQAQKEVDDLHQRTREGMLTAKLNGKQIGQERGSWLSRRLPPARMPSRSTARILMAHSAMPIVSSSSVLHGIRITSISGNCETVPLHKLFWDYLLDFRFRRSSIE